MARIKRLKKRNAYYVPTMRRKDQLIKINLLPRFPFYLYSNRRYSSNREELSSGEETKIVPQKFLGSWNVLSRNHMAISGDMVISQNQIEFSKKGLLKIVGAYFRELTFFKAILRLLVCTVYIRSQLRDVHYAENAFLFIYQNGVISTSVPTLIVYNLTCILVGFCW